MEQKNIICALLKAQDEIAVPKKSGINGAYKTNNSSGSRYATIDDILNAVRGPLKNNGIVMMCTVERDEHGFYALARLIHSSGEMLESKFPMLLEKQSNQGIASARTYAFRYVICNILALPSDEDDDGNATSFPEKKTAVTFKDPAKNTTLSDEGLKKPQVAAIEALVGADHDLGDKILAEWSKRYDKTISTYYDIPSKDFNTILNKLTLTKNPKPFARQI